MGNQNDAKLKRFALESNNNINNILLLKKVNIYGKFTAIAVWKTLKKRNFASSRNIGAFLIFITISVRFFYILKRND